MSSHTKKPPSSTASQDQQTLKCPRCNSSNTKFCYYNNYSLSQPRHFCKSCRHYWTRGGSLRNVPIGGGCRKTKKSIKPNIMAPSSSSAQRFFSSTMEEASKFFPPPTAMDFQLAEISLNKINDLQLMNNQEVLGLRTTMEQVGTTPVDVGSGLTLTGFGVYNTNNSSHSPATFTTDENLATSIETLSCLNQDLHWRLQQQRMAMFFGNSKEETVVVERPQPLLYRNLEIVNSSPSPTTKKGENQTEWYFGNNNDNERVINNNDNNKSGGSDRWNNGIQQISSWFEARRDMSMRWNSILVPSAERRVTEAVSDARCYQVLRANEVEFEIVSTERTNIVDIRTRVCSCRRWQLYGLPCAHAAAALISCGQNVHMFAEPCFTVSSYQQTYSVMIKEVGDRRMWKEGGEGEMMRIRPPKTRRPPGRPKKKVVRVENLKRPKRIVQCGRCHLLGHSQKKCTQPI